MHSFLSQAESFGEVLGGVALALIARGSGMSVTLATAAALIAWAGLIVAASRGDGRAIPDVASRDG